MSTFVKSSVLRSNDGVSFNEENNINFSENRMNFNIKPHLKMKSIQEQIKESNEKNAQSNGFFSNSKDVKSENIANLLDYAEPLNVDEDFEYFQFYGRKRQETESGWKEQQNEDIKKFKEARANIVIDSTNKSHLPVYVSKEKSENSIALEKSNFPKIKLKIAKKDNDYIAKKLQPEKKMNKLALDYEEDEDQ